MRRILLAAAMLTALLAAATPAEARHGHCGWGGGWGGGHCGFGGWGGGFRHCGWGGGWGGGWNNCGWGGIGFSVNTCRPFYNYGWNFGVPAYCYRPNYIYGGFNTPRYVGGSIGIYDYYGSTYNPNTNFNSLALLPGPATGETTPAQVLNLLRLTDRDLVADLRERTRTLPRIGPLQETTIAIGGPRAAAVPQEPRPLVNQSNIAQRRKADQQIATGDMLFREQKFHAALQRYKDAARLAPDMAEPYWRQGHALIATANFELAGGAFKRALALDPNPSRDGFSLDQLYGPATIAKTGHLEDLAAWALDHAGSSEPYFLMGVTLQYDGQRDRAAKFFARAAEMAGASGIHIAAFAPTATPRGQVPDAAAQLVENANLQPPPPPVAQPPFADSVPQPAAKERVVTVNNLVEI